MTEAELRARAREIFRLDPMSAGASDQFDQMAKDARPFFGERLPDILMDELHSMPPSERGDLSPDEASRRVN